MAIKSVSLSSAPKTAGQSPVRFGFTHPTSGVPLAPGYAVMSCRNLSEPLVVEVSPALLEYFALAHGDLAAREATRSAGSIPR